MKNIINLIILVVLLSCSSNGARKIASSESEELQAKYAQEISNIQDYIEEALVWRAKSQAYFELHKNKFSKDEHLSHQEMLDTQESGRKYLELREKLLKTVEKFTLGIGDNVQGKLTPEKGTKVDIYVDRVLEGSKNETTERKVIKVNPNDLEGKEYILKLKLALSAAVILYDNYMIGIYPYEKSWKMRRLLNSDAVDMQDELKKITDNFFNLKNRMEFYYSAKLYRKVIEYQAEKNVEIFSSEKYFDQVIATSPIYHFMTTGKSLDEQPQILRAIGDRIFDSARFLSESFSYYSSKVFGNIMGLFASREGKLKSLPTEDKNQIISKLKMLDIMLEKTPFRLTDKFIPGYYGHVAIWIGTEEELKDLGVWDEPIVAKYHELIQSGHHIIEALRPGVQINSLDHFLDIDDLLVLRHDSLTDIEKKEFVLRAFAQIGKEYDFNFDVETDKKIVCSEIVYVVFHNIEWPTKKTLGRFTISPDNVANKAVNGGPLRPILMYKDGLSKDEKYLDQFLLENLKSN